MDSGRPGAMSIGQGLMAAERMETRNLQWLASVLRRRLPLLVTVALVFAALAVVLALVTKPVFTATAQMIFDPRHQNVVNAPTVLGEANNDSTTIDTQVELIKSRAVVDDVVTRLGLTSDAEFSKPPKPSLLTRLFGQGPGGPAKTLQEMTDQNVSAHLEVRSVGLSSVIQVSFRSKDPAKAAAIANAFANAYIENQLALKAQATGRVNSWLSSRLAELLTNAERSDAALKQYEVSHGLLDLQNSQTGGGTAVQQNVQVLTDQFTTARSAAGEARAKLDQASRTAAGGAAFAEALNSPVIQALKKQRNEATAALAQLTIRYGAKHPSVATAQTAIADIDAQIAAETQRVRNALAADASVAERHAADIGARLNSAQGALENAKIASVGENDLRNRADADRAVYQSFLERFKQTSAQTGIETPDARIISVATIPTKPSSLDRRLLVAMGLLGGLAAGIILITLVEVTRGGVYSPAQLSSEFALRCFGSIPEPRSLPRGRANTRIPAIDIPAADRTSGFAEAIRGVLASEPFSLNQHKHLAVMLTSSVTSEGKSTTSIALARTLALQGRKVLLIDCDLVRPATTSMLGGAKRGIFELINGEATINEVINLDSKTGLRWIGVSEGSGVAGLFSHPNLPPLMNQLRAQYDIILLDAAPILATVDARNLAMEADRVLMVVRWAKTQRAALHASLTHMAEDGATVSGAILSRVDVRKQLRMGAANTYADLVQYEAYRSFGKV